MGGLCPTAAVPLRRAVCRDLVASKEEIMNINYSVQIAEKIHEICVAIPDWYGERDLRNVLPFAIVTAILEHSGYLPAGVTHNVWPALGANR